MTERPSEFFLGLNKDSDRDFCEKGCETFLLPAVSHALHLGDTKLELDSTFTNPSQKGK